MIALLIAYALVMLGMAALVIRPIKIDEPKKVPKHERSGDEVTGVVTTSLG